ncbi:MAG: hypothetical protein GY953_41710 [bacterium]|nr:hypothetical protein [bacterium]
MNRRRPTAGITLMELLIAVTLVSLISVAVLMAMRVGLDVMEKANNRLMSNRRVTGAQRILERQISGIMAVAAECRSDPSEPGAKLPFFQGEPDSMRFVSSYSLREASRGYPRILEFRVIPGERNEGVRLVVNELLYSGPASTGMLCVGRNPAGRGVLYRPIEVGPRSFVLADRLAYCRFVFQERQPRDPNPVAWLPVWLEPELPSAIRVEMAPIESDASALPLLTTTMPVRVSKDPMIQYVDMIYEVR